MTEREVRLWMLEESVADSWWLSVDEETSADAVTLARAADYAAANPEKSVQLLHVDQAEAKVPPWIILDPSPVMTPEERVNFSRPKSWVGLIIQMAVLLVVIAGIVYFVLPEPPPEENENTSSVVASREAMLKKLAAVTDLGAAEAPVIDATIARSGRIFFITNHNKDAWPSLTIHLQDGYVCEWREEVPSGVTMQIPFRMFLKDGQPLADGEVDLKRVVLEVPGLRKWEKIF
ncbi:MAG: hypothetical protein Q7Q73_04710 [Verrucomicrobiota bacterium JB024]|nr:hypothetical protein [Verrucomicrobiota bacterium JB024]